MFNQPSHLGVPLVVTFKIYFLSNLQIYNIVNYQYQTSEQFKKPEILKLGNSFSLTESRDLFIVKVNLIVQSVTLFLIINLF